MSTTQVAIFPLVEVSDCMTKIICSVVEECQHRGSDELGTVFHE